METAPMVTALALFVGVVVLIHFKRSSLDYIPAMGPSRPIPSYRGALDYLRDAPRIIQAGYNQHKSIFRVPYLDKWVVVLCSPELINDLRKAREEDLSAARGFGATLAVNYTLGAGFVTNPYHNRVIQTSLTRSTSTRFTDIHDEISTAFQHEIKPSEDWVAVPALQTVLRIVSRTSNRLFVGIELCRNTDYRNLSIEFAEDVIKRARIINLFPDVLKPLVGPMLSPKPRAMARARRHLVPVIEERLRMDNEYGADWDGRPNDMISWLLEHATDDERTVDKLIERILMINFAAIHTTANSFTQALYHLAAAPDYVTPLREELEIAVREDGWSKAAMGKCIKLDSFLRESQRFNGVSAINMNRMVTNPAGFTFSDGTHLPQGSFMAAATYATHHDDAHYAHAEVFDGFRFARMRAGDGGEGGAESMKFGMVTPDPTFLSFGLGNHACPGRFFAVTTLKVMLAHTFMNYEIKLEQNSGVRPPSEWFGTTCGANRSAKVLFRRRA
ncbi:Cytochrome P450 [Mycena venus]|uniref:Cytochrome P450 n=1 Tax=Mycena venus TaxID=2733690 RepID=A0A8H6Z2R7_9AGAR|nr:Cytochrome P450 [Mycena venus]